MKTIHYNGVGHAEVLALARRIASQSPKLCELRSEQLELVAQAVLFGRLGDELARMAALVPIDYRAEKELFLAQAGKTGSLSTKRAYERALCRMEKWLAGLGLSVLDMGPKDADDFIYFMIGEGSAAASVRLDTAAASSFFTFLERRHPVVRNPFRGTKARPHSRSKRHLHVPYRDEVDQLVRAAKPALGAAILCMSARGLRVGALPTLCIENGHFRARSKGRDISGWFPPEVLDAIRAAGLDERRPFADYPSRLMSGRLRSLTKKLALEGTIKAAYSCHDLRHFFAVQEYGRTHDIYGLKLLLAHSSVAVTETYLKGLRTEWKDSDWAHSPDIVSPPR